MASFSLQVNPSTLASPLGVLSPTPDWAFILQQQRAIEVEAQRPEFPSFCARAEKASNLSSAERKRWDDIRDRVDAIAKYADMFAEHGKVLSVFLLAVSAIACFAPKKSGAREIEWQCAEILSRNLKLPLAPNPDAKLAALSQIFPKGGILSDVLGKQSQRIPIVGDNLESWWKALEEVRSEVARQTEGRVQDFRKAARARRDMAWLERLGAYLKNPSASFTATDADIICEASADAPSDRLPPDLARTTVAQWSEILLTYFSDADTMAADVSQCVAAFLAGRALNLNWACLALASAWLDVDGGPAGEVPIVKGIGDILSNVRSVWSRDKRSAAVPESPLEAALQAKAARASPPMQQLRDIVREHWNHLEQAAAGEWREPHFIVVRSDVAWITETWKAEEQHHVLSIPFSQREQFTAMTDRIAERVTRHFRGPDTAAFPEPGPNVWICDMPLEEAGQAIPQIIEMARSIDPDSKVYALVKDRSARVEVESIVAPKGFTELIMIALRLSSPKAS